uniref:Uncharacterized protein n=1 Tax=Anopheles coluzzii TaxID=1518534 RepID=A0A8W7PZW4_ANOCL
MLIGLFSLLLSVSVTLQVMQIDFERFEQLSGYDIYNSSLRVRKYNRTAVVINGTIELMVPLYESVMVSSDFFHSRLGNQQFNHYPAKFPTQNVCEFVQRFYEDYSEYCEHIRFDLFHSSRGNQQFNHYPVKFPNQPVCEFIDNFYADYSKYVDDMINLPRKGECPIAPRIIYVLNKPFPSKAVPPFFPLGLWKTQILITLSDIEIARSLRVRKYNRTAVALNGTIHLMVPLNESIMVTSDFFHSRLGNQQFNHYPVKFPTQQVCKFLENFYTDYSEYVDDFENLPAKGECPIKPCKIDILNKPFPAKAVPPFFPSGLWKAQIKLTLNDVEISRFELITKARNDLGI